MKTQELLQNASEFFGLGEVKEFERVGGGANANYRVETESETYFFKEVWASHSTQDKKAEVDYMDALIKHSVPVARYITHRTDSVYEEDGKRVMAQEWVGGDIESNHIDYGEQVARVLAQVHLTPVSGLANRNSWAKFDLVEKNVQKLAELYPDHEDAKMLVADFDDVRELEEILPTIPQSIIHGDLHRYNVMFANGKIAALIDWEEACIHASVLDVAYTYRDYSHRGDNEFVHENFKRFMRTYSNIRPLTESEIEAFPMCVKYMGIMDSVWMFLEYNHFRPNEERKNHYKEYFELSLNKFVMPKLRD